MSHKANTNETRLVDESESSNEEEFSQKILQVDDKVRIFFEKIYSAVNVDESTDLKTSDNIHYGDLTKNYNPAMSKTTVERQQLIMQSVPVSEEENDESTMSTLEFNLFLNNFKNNKKLDIKTLNLLQKSSLVDLIRRNRDVNGVICPFDEIAYRQLDITDKHSESGSGKIRPLHLYKLEDAASQLVPISVSTYLMPFFFDIFKPSELKLFSASTIDILLKLKCKYTPQIYLSQTWVMSNRLIQCIKKKKWKINADLNFFQKQIIKCYLP